VWTIDPADDSIRTDGDLVLDAVHFMFPRVEESLDFIVGGPLNGTNCAIDDEVHLYVPQVNWWAPNTVLKGDLRKRKRKKVIKVNNGTEE